jgi:hypothetical protein
MKAEATADSGERTRLACWRWRLRHRALSEQTTRWSSFGEAPKGARDGACGPQT